MDFVREMVDVVLHLDRHLNEWAGSMGMWLYVLLFVIVFCETGLVVTPFLPGDSLLFAVGALCSVENASISLPLAMIVLLAAAIIGDAVNYSIGRYLGPAVFTSPNSRFLNPKHLQKTHEFYEKYGGKTIVIARFVPIVRTFAPFVAGIGQMDYRHFATWNVLGAVLWVSLLTLAGYFFGQIPIVKQNFETVILAIIVLSILPMVVEYIRARRGDPRTEP